MKIQSRQCQQIILYLFISVVLYFNQMEKNNIFVDVLLGGFAGMGACLFTNPLEVVKTRMQLQGELKARGKHAIHYKNALHAMYAVARTDGILALQKGLVPALWVQLFLNGFRLGIYQASESRKLTLDEDGKTVFYKSAIVGAIGSAIGSVTSSPFSLIKTHLQSQATDTIAVGHQHKHRGLWSAFRTTYTEYGFRGLFRGAGASIPRTCVGGGSQILTFAMSKEWLEKINAFPENTIFRVFVASLFAGVVMSVVITPFDLILTRLYNQGVNSKGKGLLYNGYLDCARKIWKSEGILAFSKGLGPNYFRLGPHSMLCLIFWNELKNIYTQMSTLI